MVYSRVSGGVFFIAIVLFGVSGRGSASDFTLEKNKYPILNISVITEPRSPQEQDIPGVLKRFVNVIEDSNADIDFNTKLDDIRKIVGSAEVEDKYITYQVPNLINGQYRTIRQKFTFRGFNGYRSFIFQKNNVIGVNYMLRERKNGYHGQQYEACAASLKWVWSQIALNFKFANTALDRFSENDDIDARIGSIRSNIVGRIIKKEGTVNVSYTSRDKVVDYNPNYSAATYQFCEENLFIIGEEFQ